MVKILYLDTNAIVKYFVEEKGSGLVRRIVDNRMVNSYTLHTSQIARYEFDIVLHKKTKLGLLNIEQRKKIIAKSKHYFGGIFHIRDYSPRPKFTVGDDVDYLKLCKRYDLNVNEDGRDARHMAVVVNYLRCFSGISKPIVVTSDADFVKIIKNEGFRVINPEKDSFLSLLEVA